MKTKIALISLFNIDFGIRYISSFLNSQGYPTYVISFGILRQKEKIMYNNYITSGLLHQEACPSRDADLLIKLLVSLSPDLVGISVPSTSLMTAITLTREMKKKLNVPVIWGGIHPTLCPEDCIKYADFVCVGEGELPVWELVQALEKGDETDSIKNLWIKRKDGSVEKNRLRDLIADLDSLPYPDFIIRGNKFLIDKGSLIHDPVIFTPHAKNTYSIMSSRGCHFSCSFCCNSVLKAIYNDLGSYLRRRSPGNVIDELSQVRKSREILEVRFWDDIFTYDQDWIHKFCNLYTKKIALPFTCYAHPRYTNKEIIRMLVKAGLHVVDIGIQSGSESFCRNRLNREQDNEEIINFTNMLQGFGIIARPNIIADNPYEDDRDFDSTAELLMRFPRPYRAEIYSLCYFPKTMMTNQALRDNLIEEKDVEGNSNKALNNFYMFISLAKDKKRYFWDIVIAMVVSGYFSARAIRRFKSRAFFKRYPGFLFSILKIYLVMSIFPYLGMILCDFFRKKSISTHRCITVLSRFPNIFFKPLELYTGVFRRNKMSMYFNSIINMRNRLIFDGKDAGLGNDNLFELCVYPKDSSDSSGKSFTMTIKPTTDDKRSPLSLSLLVNMHTFRDPDVLNKESGFWEINLEVSRDGCEMEISLLFPRLFFIENGVSREAVRRCSGNSLFLPQERSKSANTQDNGNLNALHFFVYDKSKKRYILKNNILVNV